MSWTTHLQDASFRGVRFDCQRTQDAARRDTASLEYPYRDGADVEDLGSKARQIQLTAVFWGPDYGQRLQRLLDVLSLPGYGELVHPVFGSVPRAQLTGYQVSHDAESPDYCTVELEFVEATPADPLFLLQLPQQLTATLAQLSQAAREYGISTFADAIDALRASVPMARQLALRQVLQGTLGTLQGLLPGSIAGTLDPLLAPRAFAGDVTALLYGLTRQPHFSAVAGQSDWCALVDTLGPLPRLAAQVADGSHEAGGQPVPAAADDVAITGSLLQLLVATALADTAATLLAAEATAPARSPQEIEQLASDTRAALQAALQACRDSHPVETARPVTEALKDVALGLQNAAIALIAARPPLLQRRVEAAGNLHLQAYRWYGDAGRAGELLRLNPQLRNPNTLQAGDFLHAYAR
ncbi:DNA circularization protein [Laribacter hongkongensis]|mgnify:CR=1 FL=1|uniref:DNA circularization protein n=1 Tax=Laribacter hongkongensis TaxID=168471 RepID=UPI00040AE1EB|nr:DNA circularization N-terminal domain-containing protein [Laribacter hongkongensis]